jgi:hypothetical protein
MAAQLNARITATKVMTVSNLESLLRGQDRVDIYRRDHCRALVLDSDAQEHLLWHNRLLYHH